MFTSTISAHFGMSANAMKVCAASGLCFSDATWTAIIFVVVALAAVVLFGSMFVAKYSDPQPL